MSKSIGDVVVVMSSSILFQGLQEVKNIPQKIINDTRGTRNGKQNRAFLRAAIKF